MSIQLTSVATHNCNNLPTGINDVNPLTWSVILLVIVNQPSIRWIWGTCPNNSILQMSDCIPYNHKGVWRFDCNCCWSLW